MQQNKLSISPLLQEGLSKEPINQLYTRLLEKAEGKNNLLEVNSKDLLVQVINDDNKNEGKKDFYNKLLRKAVFHGNADVVELVLTETRDIGV